MIQALWVVLAVAPTGEVERLSLRPLPYARAVALEADLRGRGVEALAARVALRQSKTHRYNPRCDCDACYAGNLQRAGALG